MIRPLTWFIPPTMVSADIGKPCRVPVYSLPWLSDERWLILTMEQEKAMNGYVTPMQYANKCGVHYHTVLIWISRQLVPCIKRKAGRDIWYLIPDFAKPPVLKPGPKPKQKP